MYNDLHDGWWEAMKQVTAVTSVIGGRQSWVRGSINCIDLHFIFTQPFGGGDLTVYKCIYHHAVWHAIDEVYSNGSCVGCRPSLPALWCVEPLSNILIYTTTYCRGHRLVVFNGSMHINTTCMLTLKTALQCRLLTSWHAHDGPTWSGRSWAFENALICHTQVSM